MKAKVMKNSELKSTLEFTRGLALEAGEMITKFSKKLNNLKLTYKEGMSIATNADVSVERYLIKKIKKKFPEHLFIAEESFAPINKKKLEKSFYENNYWLIDPLDGTNNFVCGFPYYCTSIGFAIKGEIVLGVVYRPDTQELFYALKGQGSFYQKIGVMKKPKRIKPVKNTKMTRDCVFISEVLPKTNISRRGSYRRYKNIAQNSRGLRRLGSAALDMCYVSLGIFDGYWQSKLSPWDFAGAYIICREAGVKVTDYKGQPFDPLQKSVLVSKLPLFDKIIYLLHGHS